MTIVDDTALLAEADLQSWDATNFTLNWTANNGPAYVVHFIAIGGPTVSAKLVNWTMATATGNKSVTGVGFQPDVVLHAHLGQDFTAAAPASGTDAHFGLGVMDKSGGQWANAVLSVNGVPANTQRGQQTNGCLYDLDSALTVQKKASFVSMDADGFTVNFTNATSALAGQVISLALKGVPSKAGSFLKSSTSSSPSYVQSRSLSVGGVATLAMSFPAASTSGDLVVVSFDFNNQSRTVTSVTDNLGNVYTNAIGPTDWGTGERVHLLRPQHHGRGRHHHHHHPSAAPRPATSRPMPASSGAWPRQSPGPDLARLGNGNRLEQRFQDDVLSRRGDLGVLRLRTARPPPMGRFAGRETLNRNFTADCTARRLDPTPSPVPSPPPSPGRATCRLSGGEARQSVAGVGFSAGAVLLSSVQDVTQANPVPHARLGLGAADNRSGQGTSALADHDTSNPTSVQGDRQDQQGLRQGEQRHRHHRRRGGRGQLRRRRVHPRLDDQRPTGHGDPLPGAAARPHGSLPERRHHRQRPEHLRPDRDHSGYHGHLQRRHAGQRGGGRRAAVQPGIRLDDRLHPRPEFFHRVHGSERRGLRPYADERRHSRQCLQGVHLALRRPRTAASRRHSTGRERQHQCRRPQLRHVAGPRCQQLGPELRLLRRID